MSRARQLRRAGTDAERRLWTSLRTHQVDGHGFRRQQPIGPYIVDFCCPPQKLVVEIDGGHHGNDETAAKDAARSHWLKLSGYRVIRFWNNDVLNNTEGVIGIIRAALAAGSPPPPPSPARGEGE